jgi:hypothetical protein
MWSASTLRSTYGATIAPTVSTRPACIMPRAGLRFVVVSIAVFTPSITNAVTVT